MEIAIPILALGGMYVISNQANNKNVNVNVNKKKVRFSESKKENFDNMGQKSNYLPNTNIPPQNYPIMNNKELAKSTILI